VHESNSVDNDITIYKGQSSNSKHSMYLYVLKNKILVPRLFNLKKYASNILLNVGIIIESKPYYTPIDPNYKINQKSRTKLMSLTCRAQTLSNIIMDIIH
jgi:hypothetical protein